MVTRHPGALLARGNTSDVYAWGPRSIVKLLRPGIPPQWAEREARTTTLVCDAGLPAPRVEDTVVVDDRPGIVLERIDGISMWDRMRRSPRDVGELSRLIADLQQNINATPAPTGLPTLHDRLRGHISKADRLTRVEAVRSQTLLSDLPTGTSLCHFDMHPDNVLLAKKGPVVIDWFDAAAGIPAADIVRSSVLMRSDAFEAELAGARPEIVKRFHDQYIASIVAMQHHTMQSLLRWEPIVLAARLAELLDVQVLAATERALRRPQNESPLWVALIAAAGVDSAT